MYVMRTGRVRLVMLVAKFYVGVILFLEGGVGVLRLGVVIDLLE